jgi:hypothetical protein
VVVVVVVVVVVEIVVVEVVVVEIVVEVVVLVVVVVNDEGKIGLCGCYKEVCCSSVIVLLMLSHIIGLLSVFCFTPSNLEPDLMVRILEKSLASLKNRAMDPRSHSP